MERRQEDEENGDEGNFLLTVFRLTFSQASQPARDRQRQREREIDSLPCGPCVEEEQSKRLTSDLFLSVALLCLWLPLNVGLFCAPTFCFAVSNPHQQ